MFYKIYQMTPTQLIKEMANDFITEVTSSPTYIDSTDEEKVLIGPKNIAYYYSVLPTELQNETFTTINTLPTSVELLTKENLK